MDIQLNEQTAARSHRLRPSLISILTDQTCGDACWHAREEVCRCSCGGENHGCLRTPDGEQPVRTCKIAGERYELAGVGWQKDLYREAERMNEINGWRSIDGSMGAEHRYHYSYRETDDGAPARLKPAPAAAIEKWPELRAFREHPDFNAWIRKPYLLWKKINPAACYWCEESGCRMCEKLRARHAEK